MPPPRPCIFLPFHWVFCPQLGPSAGIPPASLAAAPLQVVLPVGVPLVPFLQLEQALDLRPLLIPPQDVAVVAVLDVEVVRDARRQPVAAGFEALALGSPDGGVELWPAGADEVDQPVESLRVVVVPPWYLV